MNIAVDFHDSNKIYVSTESKYEDDFEEDEDDKKRHIIGLKADESRVNGKTVSVDVAEKEKEEEREGTLPPHRRVSFFCSKGGNSILKFILP